MSNVIEGDLLDVTEGVIVHQVNCKGVIGAGLVLLAWAVMVWRAIR